MKNQFALYSNMSRTIKLKKIKTKGILFKLRQKNITPSNIHICTSDILYQLNTPNNLN